MRSLALAAVAVAALALSGQARADFIDFSQFGPTGRSFASPATGTTLDGVSFTVSDVGNAGFAAYCEDKARQCAASNTWAGEFYKNEVVLFNNGARSPVTIDFAKPITSLIDLQAQANAGGAFTETVRAFNGTTQVAIDSADWFNSVSDPTYGEGTIPKLNVAFAGGITSLQISTTNDGDGLALGGIGGTNNNPVPEPASMVLMMTALLGLGLARHRRGRR